MGGGILFNMRSGKHMQPIPAIDNKARKVCQAARIAQRQSRNYIGFMVIDYSGKISLCSDRVASVLGCDPAALEGAKLAEHLFDNDNKGISPDYFGRNKANFGYKFGWHRLNVMTADGRCIQVEGSSVKFNIDQAPMMLLHLRHQEET
jgi:hypothetical protein